MAPNSQIISRDTTPDSSDSNAVTPVVIAGLALAGAVILALCLWLGIRTYRKRSGRGRANSTSSWNGEKAISQPRHVSLFLQITPLAPGLTVRRPLPIHPLQNRRHGRTQSVFPGPVDGVRRPATQEHPPTQCDQRRNFTIPHRERNHDATLLDGTWRWRR